MEGVDNDLDLFDKANFDIETFDDMEFASTFETFTTTSSANVENLSKVPEDYDYDMETSHNIFFWDELLPTLIVYCLTFVLGLVGNVLIVFTISRYRKMKSTTNVFLASLASSDLLLILFCIPVKGFHAFVKHKKSKVKNESFMRKMTCPTTATFHEMKTVLDSILINEEEEVDEEILAEEDLDDCFMTRSSSEISLQPEDKTYETTTSFLPQTTSKFTLMESSLASASDAHSELEDLMCKLSEEIKKCSQFIKKLNITTREKRMNRVKIKSSASDTKVQTEKDAQNKMQDFIEKNPEYSVYPVMFYPASEKPLRKNKLDGKCITISSDHKCKKPYTSESNTSLLSFIPTSATSFNETKDLNVIKRSNKYSRTDFPCCDDCKYLKKRIMKLEKELDKLERKMPLYPEEYQETIKMCLEKLKTTSETVLKRLRSCAKLKFLEHQKRSRMECSCKRPFSAPEPILSEVANRKLTLKSSSSDYELNVGMKITMENVDPLTGNKLPPENNCECEQEGNIQCKLFKDGEDPLLVMDTDFVYNPKTGMLFKKKSSEKTCSEMADLLVPLKNSVKKSPSATNLIKPPTCPCCSVTVLKCSTSKNDTFEAKEKSLKISSFERSICQMAQTSSAKIKNAFKELVKSKSTISIKKDKKINKEEEKSEKANARMEKETIKEKKKTEKIKKKETEVKNCNKAEEKEIKKKKEEKRQAKSRESSRKNSEQNLQQDAPESKHTKVLKVEEKQIKNEKPPSRIPTRRRPTPNFWKSKANNPSPKSSLNQFPKPEEVSNTQFECFTPSPSKISLKLAKLFSFTWTFGFFLCKLVHYMQSVSAICSVLTLTAMSLERYYAIVHPMKAQYICTISQAKRIITGTWISAFLLAVPILFAQVHLRVGVKVEAYWCVRDWDNKTIWRAHELYMMLLILVVPTGVMAVAYTAICWEIWEVIQRRQDMTSGKGHGIRRKPRYTRSASADSFPSLYTKNSTTLDGKKKGRGMLKKDLADDGASVKQVIKMLVAVVVIYVLCWGPMLIDNVLQAYGILSHIRMGWMKYMGTAFHLMAYFNSCINPIIYGFMSKNFRESFMKTLCCGGKKPKTALRSFSLSQTRNTSIRYAESSFGRTVSIALPV